MAKRRSRAPLSDSEKRPLNKKNFKKLSNIFQYMLPYKYTFALGMLCLFLGSATLLAFPFLTGKLVDAALGESDWISDSIDEITLMLVGVLVAQSVFSFLRVYLFAQVSERGIADIRSALFGKLMTLTIPFFDNRRTGELISRITSDVSLLQDTFSITLAEFIRQLITLLGGIVFIFYSAPKLSVFMLATFPVVILLAMIFGKYIRKMSKKTQDKLADTNIIVEETLQSIHIVKAFTSEFMEVARYGKSLSEVVKIALKTASFRGAFIAFIIVALFGGIVAVMWKGANLVQDGTMSVGDLLSFVFFTTFIGGSIAGLGSIYGQIQRSIGASERILEVIQEEPEIELAQDLPEKASINGAIRFKEVAFSYPTRRDVQVLRNVNFKVEPGEKVALVGHSGAGKSTIIQLLTRFYNIDHGEITVDDRNINDYDLHAYRQNIGMVPQEVILFGGTIRENIAYGKQGATEEEIIEAATRANAMQFIETFPDGLNTIVGERGMKLSGGQKQRIAIARAILKDPTILILDEATSSLDAESEHYVQNALDELMKNRTTIIIAHRLATIRKVDKIYVINNGEIIESGSHDELSAVEDGVYNNLVKLQFHDIS
ncbi:ABC transporter transmembrane domain-containing protein [Fulvivirgaceae bacterium BMA10]|uniref:ABC transporter transmembrane domain-containing protein n=1 Tax=Splendidivirga corallicola TaxID=3051826 RepID=A0ABT8KM54_9BACT|nr:ABC transporter transmembrane domain-containing protein [Fulvivirgaceae bacterium BMA10]